MSTQSYKINCTTQVIADCPSLGASSVKINLYKNNLLYIFNRMKDMWDSDIEYWQTSDGWWLKIERNQLQYFDKI